MEKEFILALIGGIFGILGGIIAVAVGSVGAAFGMGSGGLYAQGALAVIFSIVGIICGSIIIDRKRLAGGLMILSAIIVLVAVSLFGVLTFILFLISGILILRG